jgi:homoserine kinase
MVSGSGSSLIALFPDAVSRRNGAEAVKELLKSDPVSAVFELQGE